MGRKVNFPSLTISRLVDTGISPTEDSRRPKKRRAIPMSNRPANSPSRDPQEFNLRDFAFTSIPDPHSDDERFNNDLTIECYSPSPFSYSGAQRKGLSEPFPDASSYHSHIWAALKAPFPLFSPTPLPRDLTVALEFNRDNTRETISNFRRSQMRILRTIADECRAETDHWYSFAPPEIRESPNKIHIALLTHLTRFTRIGGTNWLMQFIKGFPISGKLCQRGVFPMDTSATPELVDPESLFETKTARFRARAPKATSRFSQQLWDEASAQVKQGWLHPPEPLNSEGNFTNNLSERFNVAFRFGVSQADKLRGCDDFKDSLTNKTCIVQSPITLPGWDHIAAAARTLSASEQSWAFGKIDHRDAYKSLPLRPSESNYAIIALYQPESRRWFGFRPKTQLFGSTAAVLHYNCLSRIIASLACRILLIPTIGYFDDFGFLCIASEAALVMADFAAFFQMFGLELKLEKSAIGSHIVFLGLLGSFPNPSNHMTLSLSLAQEKSERWINMIRQIIADRKISHMALESLIGRLAFAQTAVFGRFVRAMLKPLYAKLYTPHYNPHLSEMILRNLARWRATLTNINPRVIKFDRSHPDWVLYTDAAFEESGAGARIAAVLFKVSPGGPSNEIRAELLLYRAPDPGEIAFFEETSTIFGLELVAAVLAIFHQKERLRNSAVTLYMDNNAALAALINGDSSAKSAFYLIALFWFLAAKFNIAIWLERVDTKRNIADLPTRSVKLPFEVRESHPFPTLYDALGYYTRYVSPIAPSLSEQNELH